MNGNWLCCEMSLAPRCRTGRHFRDGNDLRVREPAGGGAADRARLLAGPGAQLLYGSDFRSQGARFRHRVDLRRRTLRRPDGHLRNAEHVGCRHFVRCGPHLRRDDRPRPVPRRYERDDPCADAQFRRRGGARIPETGENLREAGIACEVYPEARR